MRGKIAHDDFRQVVDQTQFEDAFEVEFFWTEFQGKNGHAPRVSSHGFGSIHAGVDPALAQHVFESEVGHERVSHDAGLKTAHVPITAMPMPAQIKEMANAISELPKPIFAYCRSGNRSSILFHAANG
ncbi:MAG: hypothetical protein EBY53_06945 [Rhodobacteraceae bacterium]|nr:hypothetical protein [Paracoccaceae bacterium]